jgi:hypothetical protein
MLRLIETNSPNINIHSNYKGYGIVLRPKINIDYNLSKYNPTKNISEFEGFFSSIGDFFGNIGSGIGNVFSSIGKNIGNPFLLTGLVAAGGIGAGLATGIIPSPFAVSASIEPTVFTGAYNTSWSFGPNVGAINPLESLGPLTLPIDALPISGALPSIVNETGDTILNTGMNVSNTAIDSTSLTAPISGLNPFNVASNPLAINLPGTTDLLNQLNPNLSLSTINPLFTQPTSNLVQTLDQQGINTVTNLTNTLNAGNILDKINPPANYYDLPSDPYATMAEQQMGAANYYDADFANRYIQESPQEVIDASRPVGSNVTSQYPASSTVNLANTNLQEQANQIVNDTESTSIKDVVKDVTSSPYSKSILTMGAQLLSKFFGSGQQSASQQSTQSASPNTQVYVIGQTSNQAPNTSSDMYNNQGAYLPGSQSVGDSGSSPNSSIPTTDGTASPITQAIQKYVTPTNVKYGLIGMGLLILISTLKSSGSKGGEFKLVRIK